VAQFSTELQQGTSDEGVANTSKEVFVVVLGLGLSANPGLLAATGSSYAAITQFLKANRPHAERMMFFTKHPTNHAMRIKEIADDGVTVMDPEQYDFTTMTWPEFEARQPTLLLL
jgi:hypothetical protein